MQKSKVVQNCYFCQGGRYASDEPNLAVDVFKNSARAAAMLLLIDASQTELQGHSLSITKVMSSPPSRQVKLCLWSEMQDRRRSILAVRYFKRIDSSPLPALPANIVPALLHRLRSTQY